MAKRSDIPGAERRKILARDKYTCHACGIVGFEVRNKSLRGHTSFAYHTEKTGVYLSVDHIVPRSRGGTNDPSNLRCLCTTCNTLKGTKSEGQW